MIKSFTNQVIRKVHDVANTAYAMRHDLYQALGSAYLHRDYTRFIILGRSRSGSNYLRGLLNSHRRIVAFGELFRSDEAIG
jgi:hypothetical protein